MSFSVILSFSFKMTQSHVSSFLSILKVEQLILKYHINFRTYIWSFQCHFRSFFVIFPPWWHFVIFGQFWLFQFLFIFFLIFIVSSTHSCPFQSFLESFCVIFSHFVIFPQNDSKSCFVIFEHFKGWTVDIKISYQFQNMYLILLVSFSVIFSHFLPW